MHKCVSESVCDYMELHVRACMCIEMSPCTHMCVYFFMTHLNWVSKYMMRVINASYLTRGFAHMCAVWIFSVCRPIMHT